MHIHSRLRFGWMAVSLAALICSASGNSRDARPVRAAEPQAQIALFAVQFTVGPKWDQSKQPQEQLFFKEHSENLKSLRTEGTLLIGGRYSDKGFIIVKAGSEAEARSKIEADPAVQNQVFKFELHSFRAFYKGCIE